MINSIEYFAMEGNTSPNYSLSEIDSVAYSPCTKFLASGKDLNS